MKNLQPRFNSTLLLLLNLEFGNRPAMKEKALALSQGMATYKLLKAEILRRFEELDKRAKMTDGPLKAIRANCERSGGFSEKEPLLGVALE